MKGKWLLPGIFWAILTNNLFAQLQPIGQWREHLEYGPAQQIVFAQDKFFVASKWGIYSVTYEDKIIERYNKITGLNDLGVKAIQYNPSNEKLLIAYNNSNLDLIYRNDIINIPYIKKSNVTGDKSINHIYMENDYAYLSTGLGIIVVDLIRHEISSTWSVGSSSSGTKVYCFGGDNNYFYAATSSGLKRIARSNNFPENFANWETLSGNNELPAGETKGVFFIQNEIFVQAGNSIFKKSNNENWTEAYKDDGQWIQVSASENMLHICQNTPGNNQTRIIQWDPASNAVKQILENSNLIPLPREASSYKNKIFVADYKNGVIIKDNETIEQISINSPSGPLDGEMIFQNNKLYVAGGSINEAWYYKFNQSGFFVYDNQEWKAYNKNTIPWMDTLLDIITIAADPATETIYAGSYSGGLSGPGGTVINGGGLIEFNSINDYKIYKQQSAIEQIPGDPSYRVSGLAFDNNRNLWFSNFGGSKNFGVKKSDGSWVKFRVPFIIFDNMVGGILIDDYNQKWIQVPQGNGIFIYNHGSSIDNPNDDRWKWFKTGKGNGNLPGNLVQAMAKDKDGFIWLGTDKGIGIIQCPGEVFTSNGCEAFQPVVQQDNFAGLLFANEEVKAIAVDGANRKWVGT
ncbi:MAG: two-component regulator propeller domain-containing protein, partial [Bacteroidota bacterium]